MQIKNKTWENALKKEFEKEYYKKLMCFLSREYSENIIYPSREDVFSVFSYTDIQDVKVVILGQDPYHNEGQAHGLSFSVRENVKVPPSLLNIYKELNSELGTYIPDNGYLDKWARQGVFLLNTVLTVRKNEPTSHTDIGWEIFTDEVIKILDEDNCPKVFMLWGKNAQDKKKLIKNKKHFILTSAHPSPLAAHRGFFSCGHFKKANEFLLANSRSVIDWQINNLRG